MTAKEHGGKARLAPRPGPWKKLQSEGSTPHPTPTQHPGLPAQRAAAVYEKEWGAPVVVTSAEVTSL